MRFIPINNRLSLVSSAPRSATERNYDSLAKVRPEASMCMDVRDTPAREETIPLKKKCMEASIDNKCPADSSVSCKDTLHEQYPNK